MALVDASMSQEKSNMERVEGNSGLVYRCKGKADVNNCLYDKSKKSENAEK